MMDTITDILARPDEAARQLSEMRAALEAVTARLAAVTSERNAFKLGLHELREQYRNSVSEEALADAQNDLAAARAEVVRLNKLVSDLIPFLSEYEYTIFYRELDAARRADALRGDTAPAQPDAPARLYGKYRISKADGSPTDPEAEYFVLRIDTDPAARDAVAAYADYISFSAPEFCDDLRRWLVRVPLKPAPAGGEARP